jgi:hypothetical protein
VQIAVLLGVAWIRWPVVSEDIVGKQKLNVTAATCALGILRHETG